MKYFWLDFVFVDNMKCEIIERIVIIIKIYEVFYF